MCQLFGSSFALWILSIVCQKYILQYWHTVCQISDTHLLCVCVCVFVLCCLVVLFRTGHLIVSWLMTAQGYMLGFWVM